MVDVGDDLARTPVSTTALCGRSLDCRTSEYFLLRLDFCQFLGHRLGDDLVDWNSGVSVRPYVRTSTKSFFRFPSNLVCG